MRSAALTAKQIQHMKPTGKRVEIPVGKPSGLYLAVQTTGAKGWTFRYRWNGRACKMTLGSYPDLSLAGARAEAEAGRADIERGVNPAETKAEEKRREPSDAESVALEWLARDVRGRVATAPEVERILRKELLPICRGKLISNLARPDFLRVIDGIVDRGSPIAANETLSIAKRFMNWCVGRGYIEASPLSNVPAPSQRKSRDRVLTDDELAALWNTADPLGPLAYPIAPFLRLLILTAQRRGEVAAMRWPDVDLDAALWTLPREATKSNRAHDVPLSPEAVEILRGLPRFVGGDFVFTHGNGSAPINSFSKLKVRLDAELLKRAEPVEREAKLKAVPFTLHDLRRTAATGMAKAGVVPHVLAALLNHAPASSQGITSIYNRWQYAQERRAALDAWAKHVVTLAASAEKQRKTTVAKQRRAS